MLETFIFWLQDRDISLWNIVIIICSAFAAYYIVKVFGRRLIILGLEKKQAFTFGGTIALTSEDEQRIETLGLISARLTRLVIVLIAATMVLAELHINVGPILAGAGVLGVALGFGAQSLVKDFLSGIFIIVENQYVKGDVIKIKDVTGKVVDISLRRTVLRDMSGVEHHIPNGEITITSNYTKDWANINFDIPVPYSSDIEQVTTILNNVADGMANDPEWKVYIHTTPTVLGIQAFGDSAILIKLHGRVNADQQWAVGRELRKRVKSAFDSNAIVIPYPHQVVINK